MAERTDFTTLGHAVEMHFSDGKTVRLDMVDAEVMAERDRARSLAVRLEGEVARLRDLAVALESAVAERDAMLRDARALMRHGAECQLLVTRWVWDPARQQLCCRACGAGDDVERSGHWHDCDCGRDSLVARIDGLIGGESHE